MVDNGRTRRLISCRTASFESLSVGEREGSPLSPAPLKKRDSSWDAKWKQTLKSNDPVACTYAKRIGGFSPGKLNNSVWEKRSSETPPPTRKRFFKSSSVERRMLNTPPPIIESFKECERRSSSSSASSTRSGSLPPPPPPLPPSCLEAPKSSPKTVKKKFIIRATKSPSPVPKEWGEKSKELRLAADDDKPRPSISSESNPRGKEGLEDDKKAIAPKEDLEEKRPSSGQTYTGTYTAVPILITGDEESSREGSPSSKRPSSEKVKFMKSMLDEERVLSGKESGSAIRNFSKKSKEEKDIEKSSESEVEIRRISSNQKTESKEESFTRSEIKSVAERSSSFIQIDKSESRSEISHRGKEEFSKSAHFSSEIKNTEIKHQKASEENRQYSHESVEQSFEQFKQQKHPPQSEIDNKSCSQREHKKKSANKSDAQQNSYNKSDRHDVFQNFKEFQSQSHSTGIEKFENGWDPHKPTLQKRGTPSFFHEEGKQSNLQSTEKRSKDLNNNSININEDQIRKSPNKSPSPTENVLTSLEKLVKDTGEMIEKHLEDNDGQEAVPPAPPPPLPPPRTASRRKISSPDKTDASTPPSSKFEFFAKPASIIDANESSPPPTIPPPPKNFPDESHRCKEGSPVSSIGDDIISNAREMERRHQLNEENLEKEIEWMDKKLRETRGQEERFLRRRMIEQRIKKEEMFRLKMEKESQSPPLEPKEETKNIFFQGSPPRPIRQHKISTSFRPQTNREERAYKRDPPPSVESVSKIQDKESETDTPTDSKNYSTLRAEIERINCNSLRRMKALRDVEIRDRERMENLRKSFVENQEDDVEKDIDEELISEPPPPSFASPERNTIPHFVVLRDPSIPEQRAIDLIEEDDEEELKAEELEIQALRAAEQKERELLAQMEIRKREIEEEIAKEKNRLEELQKVEKERLQKLLERKKYKKNPPRAVLQYEEMVAKKMNLEDDLRNTPSPPPPPPLTDESESTKGMA